MYQLRLAYDNCSKDAFAQAGTNGTSIAISLKDKDGKVVETYAATGYNGTPAATKTITTMKSTDKTPKDAYDVADDEVRYLYDTGEILIGKAVYSNIQKAQADFSVTYVKTTLKK